jgi:general secretion pathway protein F
MNFRYRALNADNETVAGELDAESQRAAARALRQRGLTPLAMDEAEAATSRQPLFRRKTSTTAVRLALQQLVTLLTSGVSLIEAVSSLARSSQDSALARTLADMEKRLQRGESFSDALANAGLRVPNYVHRLAQAGELTGNLGQALGSAVEQMEHEHQMSQEFRNALIYPSILVVAGIAAVVLIFTLVVPQFTDMLDEGAELPLLAHVVLTAGAFFNAHLWQLAVAGCVLVAAVVIALQQPQARMAVWEGVTSLPLIAAWLREAEMARWSGLLGTLLANRVEMSGALELAAGAVRTRRMGARFRQVTRRVRSGKSVADALAETDAISPTGRDMVRVGERAGELPAMLQSLSAMATDNGRQRMKRVLALIEPAAILVIGGIIGLIMAAVVLAITSVNEVPL